jgi:IS5 family transposase
MLSSMQFQPSFAQSEYARKKKVTRRDLFLAEMEAVVPWLRLVEIIEPLYPKGKRGQPPIGIERMLRIYFLQQWYGLADEAHEDAIYDSQAMRHFSGVNLGAESVPEATTLLKFRHLLEEHDLTKRIFEEVNALLSEKQLLMKKGTIVDATIIAVAPSTKNKAKERDPEMHRKRPANDIYPGFAPRGNVPGCASQSHPIPLDADRTRPVARY